MRICAKVACGREAVAACGFSYGEREVWLCRLGREPDPSTYELCEGHADALRVPKGWTLRDLREEQSGPDLFGRLRAVPVAVPTDVPAPEEPEGAPSEPPATATAAGDEPPADEAGGDGQSSLAL